MLIFAFEDVQEGKLNTEMRTVTKEMEIKDISSALSEI